MIAKIHTKSLQSDFKADTLAEFSCEVIGSRPPPKITWHLVTQSNQIIDLITKKHLSNTNQQQSSNVQIVDDEHLEEFAIFHHSPPSTNNKQQQQSNQQRLFKSTNAYSSAIRNVPNSNLINLNSNANDPTDLLSATSASKLVTKQPFIFTIDYPLLSQDGNTSSSVLKLRLSQRMHLNRLICRAQNYEVQRDSELEDQQLLNVLCK